MTPTDQPEPPARRTRADQNPPLDVLAPTEIPLSASCEPTSRILEGVTKTDSDLDPAIAGRLKRNADGLVAAIVQQQGSGEVLMMGWMDDEALHRTLTTGRGTYWSRSRQEYWVKGETSGNSQSVVEVRLDCDGDTVLVTVDQTGPACHTGAHTCFDDVLLTAGGDG
jgi:phosphoribosyl-AMP cyclohydrolase